MSAVGNNSLCVPRDFVLSAISTALDKPQSALVLETSFISNGGDSMSSIRLQASLLDHNIQLSIYAIFSASSLLLLAECPRVIECPGSETLLSTRNNDSSFHDQILPGSKRAAASPGPDVRDHYPKRHRTLSAGKHLMHERYPMTEMQLCLIRSSQENPGRNIISCLKKCPLGQIPALKEAWKHVLKLEPIFNVSFDVGDLEGWMYEKEGEIPFIWEEIDVTDEISYRKELSRPPLREVAFSTSFKVLIRRHAIQAGCEAEDETTVVWRLHHALVDNISAGLILSKVQKVLAGERVEAGYSFPKFSLQLQALQERDSKSASAFWARQAKEHPSPATELLIPPPINAHEAHRTHEAHAPGSGRIWSDFSPDRLMEVAKQMGVTTASLYHTAWVLVMAKYTNSDHVCLGTVISGRSLPIKGVQSVVGPIINTLPLSVSLELHESVGTLARRVCSSLLDLTSFQWSTPDHGFCRKFSSAVNVISEMPAPSCVVSDFPIQIDIQGHGRIGISYDTQAYSEANMHRLSEALGDTLNAIQEPGATVMSCLASIVSVSQLKVLADMGNWTAESTRHTFYEDSLVSLFDRVATTGSETIAVEHCSRVLTYGKLHEQSTCVAQQLAIYVDPGDVICVHADGTPDWIIAIYAVLKAGATYCPLDPTQPSAVRARNLASAGAKMFLTGTIAAKATAPASCELCLSVEELLLKKSNSEKLKAFRTPQSDSIAYICLTSGSTGMPKAVQCRHRSLVAFQTPLEVRLCARPGWRIAQFMSPAFDGSIHEIFSALSYGATLVLKNSTQPFENLKTSDAAILTPSVAKVLRPKDFPGLKAVYLVGEVVPRVVCDTWANEVRLFNMYGPTEATCGATIKRLTAREPVTLGRPNPSTRLYILDSRQHLVPWGVVGEIYLAGVQVSAGYAGLPDETAKRFLPDIINPQFSGDFMYRTGDRAHWDDSGELVFLGRRDREIKLRGFRVNLDDLETQLKLADERCTEVAVARQKDHLVALVQPGDLDLEKFTTQVRAHIAIHAHPRHILAVESFPTNKIGKLDYNAISAISFTGSKITAKNPLRTTSERIVGETVRKILKLSTDHNIDGDAILSNLGVNSITALSLAHRLSESFRQRIPVGVILNSKTIRDLSCVLGKWSVSDEPPNGKTLGKYGVSPIEKEWWHRYQRGGENSSLNVTYACRLHVSLDTAKLVAAWNRTLERHYIFRSRYRSSDANGLVREYAKHPPTVAVVNDIDIPHDTSIPFDLDSDDDIVRVLVSPTHMLVVISHIVCDLTTLQMLLNEVAQTYQDKELPPIDKTYAQTIWSQSAPPRYLSFWTDYLAKAARCPFSLGSSRTPLKTWAGTSQVYQLPEEMYEVMLNFTAQKKMTMHQLALAAVALALQDSDIKCDITLGVPYMNRNSGDDLDVVGLFVEPLPIRIRYPLLDVPESLALLRSTLPGHDSFLDAVKRSSTAALSHAIPWHQLLAQAGYIGENVLDNPFFDAMVSFHEADQELRFPLPGTNFVPTYAEGAKFKLMAEFTARSDTKLMLRLEYSAECFTGKDMDALKGLVLGALRGLVAEEGYHVIAGRLRELRERE
ncbi:acetyl-CoA synthetase-like protein [Annulohypoxylon maeteangense]|uniref:acetyl-CoA synthetase-like protein n=1 Tax=Annulohypoxylon maeteangense TaxID=1927788 RepID=UPI0020085031|nr:acetyl-CoA synthetase-like protein [Annulohypoxylon maeteangense]KAI0886471.1 acetyl-CoA synthetase-like protein [Annulohypoxylon maeteangense]